MTRRAVRLFWRAALAALVAFLTAEACLRFLLFSDAALAQRLGRRLRDESHFADWRTPEAWVLKARLGRDEAGRAPHPFSDPLLGWLKGDVPGAPYRHAGEDQLGGRRPVLLYGDSFAACTTERADCWEGLLAAGPLGGELALLNFGVGGYGVDQMLLLLRATIDRYADRDPLVIVGILVDDDLDRCALALRTWPKPRFTLVPGGLVLEPPAGSTAEFLEEHPPAIRSYAWRFALFAWESPGPLQRGLTGRNAADRRLQALNRALVQELSRELAARDLDFFFVIFHGLNGAAEVGPFTWRERLLYETFAELELPFVSSKRALLEHAAANGREMGSYFAQEMPGLNHYTPEGNRVVFGALEAGLRGEFEPAEEYLPGAPEHPRLRRRQRRRGHRS